MEQKWYLRENWRQGNDFRGKLTVLLLTPDKGSEGEEVWCVYWCSVTANCTTQLYTSQLKAAVITASKVK